MTKSFPDDSFPYTRQQVAEYRRQILEKLERFDHERFEKVVTAFLAELEAAEREGRRPRAITPPDAAPPPSPLEPR